MLVETQIHVDLTLVASELVYFYDELEHDPLFLNSDPIEHIENVRDIDVVVQNGRMHRARELIQTTAN